jgi:hypothetical protein
VLEENFHLEMGMSSINDKGGRVLLVADGVRWDKCGSGRKRDRSLSGCSVFKGNFSKLITRLKPMLQTCVYCSKDRDHDPSGCRKKNALS